MVEYLNLKTQGELQSKDKKKQGINAYVSELEYSKLLNTYITTICTHYNNEKFPIVETKGSSTQSFFHIVACIDVDMSKFLKIKKANTNILNYDSELPQLDRSTFMVLDGQMKTIRLSDSWKLPFEYINPWVSHMIPVTGLKGSEELKKMVDSGKITETQIVHDANNPGMTTDASIIAEKREVGRYNVKSNGESVPNYHYSLFYFNQDDEDGEKTKLIKEKVRNSKWQITLLTVIFIMMVSGIVICISYK